MITHLTAINAVGYHYHLSLTWMQDWNSLVWRMGLCERETKIFFFNEDLFHNLLCFTWQSHSPYILAYSISFLPKVALLLSHPLSQTSHFNHSTLSSLQLWETLTSFLMTLLLFPPPQLNIFPQHDSPFIHSFICACIHWTNIITRNKLSNGPVLGGWQ